jgi:GNAT superfamily N-acetyltransferase
VYPDRAWAAPQLETADAARRAAGFFQRHEARVHGRLVGSGTVFQLPTSPPGTIYFGFVVRPGYEESRLPAALQRHLLQEMSAAQPQVVMTRVQETVAYRITLLEAAGFLPVLRIISSELEVAGFDPTPYAARVARLAASGIGVLPVADWLSTTENWRDRLWDLLQTFEPEVSVLERRPPATFAQFLALLAEADTEPALWGVAVDRREGRNRPVGLTLAAPLATRPGVLAAGLTGVHPAFRRQGIALALKLQTIAAARDCGYRRVRTENAADNPLLALNFQLGFKPAPALVDYARPARLPDQEG